MKTKLRNKGFTLAELLIAIGIIALLVTIGVVAGGKMFRYANEKKTYAIMEMLNNAILAYQEDLGEYPSITGTATDQNEYQTTKGSNSDESLPYFLISNSFAQERLKDLPEEAFSDDFETDTTDGVIDDVTGGFVDAWGNPFLYSPEGGMGRTPVIVSAGPDGKVWDGSDKNVKDLDLTSSDRLDDDILDTSQEANKDNLYSDKN